MLASFRRNTIAAAAVVATGALALSAPGMAAGLFEGNHVAKSGAAAKQAKTQYWENSTDIDNFDTCGFTTVVNGVFVTQAVGIVSVHGQVGAARDVDLADEGILTTRILIDGHVASAESSANLENGGTQDAASTVFGARKVGKGAHQLSLQIEECGPGKAFVYNKSLLAQYAPTGSAVLPQAGKAKKSTNR